MVGRTCKTALGRSGIPGMDWCLNPYVGCTHGCVYCYASFIEKFNRRPEPWGKWVEPRSNIARVLAGELSKPRSGRVQVSSVTDAWQPLEREAGLTRDCLKVLAGSGLDVSILTKSDLVARDVDILASFGGLLGDGSVRVGFSVCTLSDELAALIEPGAPPPSRRMAALKALSAAGVRTWVFIAPALPGISDTPGSIAAIEEMARCNGAAEVDVDPLNFYPDAVRGLLRALSPTRPDLAEAVRAAASNPGRWCSRFRRDICTGG